jgi:foldase protein PrsA
MKNKYLKFFSVGTIILILSVAGWVFSTGSHERQLNAIDVYLNGSPVKVDTILDDGNIYVPIEEICYYLKCDYEKDDTPKTINFIKYGKTVKRPTSIHNAGNVKKSGIKISESGYETMLGGLHLYIEPIVYDHTLFINLKYLAQSFEMDTRWGFFKKTVKLEDYPAEYAGVVNGEKIRRRFYNERSIAGLIQLEESTKKQQKNNSRAQKEQVETEAFNETVDLILASQMARKYGITIGIKEKQIINWYLQGTVEKFGGIDKLRERVGKFCATYQDGINYFMYGVLREELKEKVTQGIKPSEEQMREYYAANKESFISPVKAVVQQIVIPVKDKDENSYSDEKVEEQRKLADKISGLLKDGGDFDALRKKYSVDYFDDTAGEPEGFEVIKGSLSIAQVFEDAVFALEPGQISEVVKTYRGFHIIKLISKTKETAQSFEEAKERIAKDLEYSVKAAYFNSLMQTWQEKSAIKRF